MLILSRKKGESIRIGDEIIVKFLGPSERFPDQIRLGISAPKEVNIVRTELVNGPKKEV